MNDKHIYLYLENHIDLLLIDLIRRSLREIKVKHTEIT